MNTKQLTTLWYGVLATVAVLLVSVEDNPWLVIVAIALVTAVLIYTFSSHHSARLGRVALAIAAPFLLAGVIMACVYGYRAFERYRIESSVAVEAARLSVDSDCLAAREQVSVDTTEQTSTTQDRLDRLKRLLTPCHQLAGTVTNPAEVYMDSVVIDLVLRDSMGERFTREMRLDTWTIFTPPEIPFDTAIFLPGKIPAQPVDTVRVVDAFWSES